jgi:hypothetical protein
MPRYFGDAGVIVDQRRLDGGERLAVDDAGAEHQDDTRLETLDRGDAFG